jgi:hypothetical protein
MTTPSRTCSLEKHDSLPALREEDIYEVWLNCYQRVSRVHDRDDMEALGNPENRERDIPHYFTEAQRNRAAYIILRESVRVVGRC